MRSALRHSLSYWRNLIPFGLSTLLLSLAFLSVRLAHQRALGLVHPKPTVSQHTPADVGIDHWRDVSFQLRVPSPWNAMHRPKVLAVSVSRCCWSAGVSLSA